MKKIQLVSKEIENGKLKIKSFNHTFFVLIKGFFLPNVGFIIKHEEVLFATLALIHE